MMDNRLSELLGAFASLDRPGTVVLTLVGRLMPDQPEDRGVSPERIEALAHHLLRAAAHARVLGEREACARTARHEADEMGSPIGTGARIAAAIRTRNEP